MQWLLATPWLAPSQDGKGGGLGVRPAPPSDDNLLAMKTPAKESTSPGRRSEADHAKGLMTSGDQSREDVLIADLLTPKRRTRVGFWNVRTLFQSGRIEQAIRETNNYNMAIMGITEDNWAGAGKQSLISGETNIWSWRQDNKHQDGVALNIASKYVNTLLQWKPISNRLVYVMLHASHVKLSITVAYASNELADEEDMNDFYYLQQMAVVDVPRHIALLFHGEFNARVGCNNNNREIVIGKH